MKNLIAFLLGIAYVSGALPNLWQYDMMPDDNVKNESDGKLGICYGSSTTWSSYPYSAALRSAFGNACCSGTIVSLNPGIVLSAAHCNVCTGPVVIGCNNPANCDGTSYSQAQFLQHPSYGQGTSFSNDLALVRLSGPITNAGAQTRNIPQVEVESGTARVVGYGQTETGSIPTQLQTMTSSIIEQQQCESLMSGLIGSGNVDQSMVCILGGAFGGSANVPTMCSGDSGGPMVVGNNVIGANSWVLQGSGGPCSGCACCKGYPQVGASTANAYNWLMSNINAWTEEYKVDLNDTTQTV